MIEPGQSITASQRFTIEDASLWSPDSPNLYTANVELRGGDTIVDSEVDRFGIRTVSADASSGLRINGKPVKLRCACIHHDNGVIGAHTLDVAEDRRVKLLKSGGYNAIRSAHNPASVALLRACDRHGVLVMDELTDTWWRPKVADDTSAEFAEWWERDLAAMVAKMRTIRR